MYADIFFITLFIFGASSFLSWFITFDYRKTGGKNKLYWSLGLWFFAFATLLEILFSAGYYNRLMADSYIFIVAFLVQLLAAGSIVLLNSKRISTIYLAYSMIADAFLIYALATQPVGNLILNGVFHGTLPALITIGSSVITVPAAVILVVVSLLSLKKKMNLRIVSIILGIIVLSATGALYIASFPAFLYVGNLVGILLLWLGFLHFGPVTSVKGVKEHVNG